MIILPAIDIKDGNCVRLQKGVYSTAHKVADSPYEAAKGFAEAGAEWMHMVDLDGAKDAKLINADLIADVAKASGLKVEVGGGIRSMEAVEYYLSRGINRVILGSAAVKDPQLVIDAVRAYGDKIAVGIDAKNGMVQAEGWLDDSEIEYIELAKQLDDLSHEVSCNIIASGGVAVLKDIINLFQLDIYGAICGKAIYSGTLDLKQAIEITKKI